MALTNSQYDSIIREYNKVQSEHRRLYEERMTALYQEYPQFPQIDEEISSLSIQSAKKLLSGDKYATKDLEKEIKKLGNDRKQLLEKLGYPSDYLEMTYDCKDCKDTGYIGNQKCHCFIKATIDLLYTQSNIKEIIERENFSTFSYDYFSKDQIDPVTGQTPYDTMKSLVKECKSYIENFDHSVQNFFFYGLPGVGKTFLTNCIAKELLDRNHSVIYFTAFELFDKLAKNTFSKDSNTEDMEQFLFDCDLLIIDDLGTELTNSFVSSQLFLCINERLLRKKSTIISTNLSFDKFYDIYSERTFSRVSSSYTMCRFTGDDIRQKKKLI